MEPLSTMILFASLAGIPATMNPNWNLEKKEKSPILSSATTPHYFVLQKEAINTNTCMPTGIVGEAKAIFNENVFTELSAYKFLSPGWDGEDSNVPDASDIERALAFVRLIPFVIPLPKPMISRQGKIGLYWSSDLTYADIGFESDGTVSLYIRNRATLPITEKFFDEIDSTNLNSEWYSALLELLVPLKIAA